MKRLAVGGIAFATALVGLAYGSAFLPGGAPGWAPALLAAGTALILVAMMALGSQRRGSIGSLWVPFTFVLLVVGGGLGALLVMPAADPADPALVLGLPPRAALLLYGIGLLPTLVVPVAYALTFDRLTLSEEDLERVRAAARAGAGAGGGAGAEAGAGAPDETGGHPRDAEASREVAGEGSVERATGPVPDSGAAAGRGEAP